MVKWAEVLNSRTPSTDYRWLALPHDMAHDSSLAHQANSVLIEGNRANPLTWTIHADEHHVWFVADGRVSDIFGDEAHGIRISQGGAMGDLRPNRATAGFVAKRADFEAALQKGHIPDFPFPLPGQRQTALLAPITRHYPEMWGTDKGADWRYIRPTAYEERVFPQPENLPDEWREALQEAQNRLAKGEHFRLELGEGRAPFFRHLVQRNSTEAARFPANIERPIPAGGSGKVLAVASALAVVGAVGAWLYHKRSSEARPTEKITHPVHEGLTRSGEPDKPLTV